MEMQETPYYREEQRFTQPWLWLLIILCSGSMIILFGIGMFQQLVRGVPWGDNPMSDTMMWIMGPFFMIFGVVLALVFNATRLIVEVRPSGVYLRYYPFHRKFHPIPLEKTVKVEAVTYRPILEYGGWGIRYARKGKVYNVSGNRGVRFDMQDGTHVLIGSQEPERLAEAVKGVWKRTG